MKILNELILSLETAKQIKKSGLNMGDWGQECGSVHCVIGWYVETHPRYGFSFVSCCHAVSRSLDNKLLQFVGKSIWQMNSEKRRSCAIKSNKFTDVELMHPHLTSLSTFDDAISWIQLINDKELSV
jgi:hypothetical protein